LKHFYDMSQPVYHNCPGWPTYKMTMVTYEAIYTKDLFNAERIDLNAHTGTHVDAPFHFFPYGKTVDEIDVEKWQGEAVLVDLRGKVKAKQGILPSDLEDYDDLIQRDRIVLLNTGWGKKRQRWDKEYEHDYPYITGELASFLVKKGVKGCGIDTLSAGGWYEGTGRPCHEELLSHGIWILEELYFSDELMKNKICYLTAYPIKLLGFSGAPVRAVAVVEED
jgi:arylformamidase